MKWFRFELHSAVVDFTIFLTDLCRNFAHFVVFLFNDWSHFLVCFQKYCFPIGFFPSFHFEYLIVFQKLTGVLQHFVSSFSLFHGLQF